MIEKRLPAVVAQSFTLDPTALGRITLATTYPGFTPFKVKQNVVISATGQPNLELEVKRVFDDEVTLEVGPRKGNIDARTDLSLYTTDSKIFANEQQRPTVPFEEVMRAVYDAEPVVALRTFAVDRWGRPYTTENPFPVQLSDGSINIGSVNAELEVQLSHKDNDPDLGDVADSVQVGDGTEILEVNPDGSINVNIIGGGLGGAGITVNQFNSVNSVATTTPTDIVTYTVPVGKVAYFSRAEFSGTNVGTYEILIGGSVEAKRRTYHGGDLSGEVVFDAGGNGGLKLTAGTVIKVRVEHQRPNVGDFDARIQVVEV